MADTGAALKRRKLRKGTFSCWECKHRKIRCEFTHTTDSRCDSCNRHDVKCVSQEFDETPKHDSHGHSGNDFEEVADSIDRVEALVLQLAMQKNLYKLQSKGKAPASYLGANLNGSTGTLVRQPLRESPIDIGISPLSILTSAGQDIPSRCDSLSQYLSSMLPHPNTAAAISIRGKLPHEVLRQDLEKLDLKRTSTKRTSQVAKMTPVSAPRPVLLARKLLQLALCLQHLHAKKQEYPELRLDAPMGELARRYVDAAHFVTSHDSLLTSLDGIETLVLEGFYEINAGNLKSSWLIFRHAIGIAQLMGIPAENDLRSRAEYLWFKLLFVDRHLSLVLGLNHAVADDSFASEHLLASDTPSGRLDRIHVKVTARLIDRNARIQQNLSRNSESLYENYVETQAIDRELQEAACFLPEKSLAFSANHDQSSDQNMLENTKKAITHVYHNCLLILVHLPYLIQSLREDSAGSGPTHRQLPKEYSYNKPTVFSSSREVMSHYLLFRDIQKSRATYPGLENKVFIASVALLLARIECYSHDNVGVSEQQRALDLKAIGDVLEIWEFVACKGAVDSILCNPTAIEKLLEIESLARSGARFAICPDGNGFVAGDNTKEVSFSMAYMGTIRIVPWERSEGATRSSATSVSPFNEQLIDNYELDDSAKGAEQFPPYRSVDDSIADIDSLLRASGTIDATLPFIEEFQTQQNSHSGAEQPSPFSTSMFLQAASWAGPGMDPHNLSQEGASSTFFDV